MSPRKLCTAGSCWSGSVFQLANSSWVFAASGADKAITLDNCRAVRVCTYAASSRALSSRTGALVAGDPDGDERIVLDVWIRTIIGSGTVRTSVHEVDKGRP